MIKSSIFGSSPTLQWTPNFDGIAMHGLLLTPVLLTGTDSTLEIDVYSDTNITYAAFMTDRAVGARAFTFKYDANDQFRYNVSSAFSNDATVDGVKKTNATNGGLPPGYHNLIFNVATANIGFDLIGMQLGITFYWSGQIHRILVNNPSGTSIEIDTIIESATMPNSTDIVDKLTGNVIGSWVNLDANNPYVLVQNV